MAKLQITVAIPTYRREQVLLDTIEAMLRLDVGAAEILILDQTERHSPETADSLAKWNEDGSIRWFRLPQPSIPKAMNVGLMKARYDVVLFLDDDIAPDVALVTAHIEAQNAAPGLIAGRILQPWDKDILKASWLERQFSCTEAREIDRFMGGNFSVRKTDALAVGGFDENFIRVAYNFEREFADRWRSRGREIRFCPSAMIHHLKATTGGTRSYGEHLTTMFPAHAVGAYYYLLRSKVAEDRFREFFKRPFRSVMTRHHLHRPWWIPVTLIAEFAGMLWALVLYLRGPRYCSLRSAGAA